MNWASKFKLTIFLWLVSGSLCVYAQKRPYQAPPLGSYQVPASPDSEEFKSIQIEEKLGQKIDLGLSFLNEKGETVLLQDYFGRGKPVVVSMVYYNCPSLCGLLLNGIVDAMRRMDLSIGEDFTFLTVSVDPDEDARLASWKRENYLKDYGRPDAEKGWHFLTGKEPQIKALSEQLGFGYRYVEETGEYAHSAGFFVLTPEGVISRVHFGVMFEPKNVKLSLVEAGGGLVGSIADKVLLFCFRYDPNSKGYALAAFRIVQTGGGLAVLILGSYLFMFWRRQRRLKLEAVR